MTTQTSTSENDSLRFAFVLSLTLGLAPFVPEPHLWGKLRWIAGGAKGMQLLDYADLVFHGFPWVLLVVMLGRKGWSVWKGRTQSAS